MDHHDDLVADRSDCQRRLRWHPHDLFEDLEIPAGALDRTVWLDRVARRLARGEHSVRARIAREQVRSIRAATRRVRELEAEIARSAGVAPIEVSSGRRDRHRLDRGGNRQLNCALHRLAVNKGRWDPQSAAYLARKQAEGKSRMEALRCLKRHLARRVWKLLTQPTPNPASPLDSAPALT